MIRYVARETGRAIKRKYTLVYIIGFLVLCLIANIAMTCFRAVYGMNDGAFAYNLIIFAEGVFCIPYYSCVFLSDIVFGTEYPDPHIKDRTTVKLHRWELYIGKLIATVLLAMVMFIIAFALLIGTTVLFGIQDGTIDKWTILDFIDKASVALPLWIAGISIGQMFLFVHKSNKRNAFVGYYVLVLLIPRVIMLLASESIGLRPFVWLSGIIITPQFQALQFMFTMDRGKCWILGGIYTLISSLIGLAAYYRRK